MSFLVPLGCSREARSPSPVWQKPIQVATGEAHRGPWKMNESDYRWVDDPTVSVDDQGEIAVAWADHAQKDIFFQRYGANGERRFETATLVANTPDTFSWLPRLVLGPGNSRDVYVLWQEIVFSGGSHGGEIFFASSSDGGRTFHPPVNLSVSIAGDGKGRLDRATWDNGSLDLARGPNGELYAAWTEYEGNLWFRRSTDGGRRFSTAVRLNASPDPPARGPSIGVAGSTVYVAWAIGERRAAAIHLATSSDAGESFGPAQPAFESDGHADAPKLAVDASGTVHLAYAETAEGSGGAYHIHHRRRPRGATQFTEARRLPAPPGAHVGSAHYPQLSADQPGTLYLLWEHYARPAERPHGLVFTYSRDGGDHFAPPTILTAISGPPLGFDGSQQGLLMRKLAVNRAGTVAIVNSTFEPEAASHIWLLHGRLATNAKTLD